MKLHPISLFLLLALGALSASAQALTGDWSGRLDAGQARLSLTFHFTLHEGRYTGSMDSPDQGAYGIEADTVVTDGHRLSVCLSKAGIRYEASLEGDSLLRGTFTQGTARLPLDLRRVDLLAMRPQTPRPPFPYRSEEVSITNPQDGTTLAGTLTLPAGGQPSRAVILLTGSGTQDPLPPPSLLRAGRLLDPPGHRRAPLRRPGRRTLDGQPLRNDYPHRG